MSRPPHLDPKIAARMSVKKAGGIGLVGISGWGESANSGISATPGLKKALNLAAGRFGCVKMVIEGEQLVGSSVRTDPGQTWGEKLDAIRSAVEVEKPVYFALFRGEKQCLIVTYIPDNAKPAQKMWYASTKNSVKDAIQEADEACQLEEFNVSSPTEISYNEYRRRENTEKPYTEQELLRKELEAQETAGGYGVLARLMQAEKAKKYDAAGDADAKPFALPGLSGPAGAAGIMALKNKLKKRQDSEKDVIVVPKVDTASETVRKVKEDPPKAFVPVAAPIPVMLPVLPVKAKEVKEVKEVKPVVVNDPPPPAPESTVADDEEITGEEDQVDKVDEEEVDNFLNDDEEKDVKDDIVEEKDDVDIDKQDELDDDEKNEMAAQRPDETEISEEEVADVLGRKNVADNEDDEEGDVDIDFDEDDYKQAPAPIPSKKGGDSKTDFNTFQGLGGDSTQSDRGHIARGPSFSMKQFVQKIADTTETYIRKLSKQPTIDSNPGKYMDPLTMEDIERMRLNNEFFDYDTTRLETYLSEKEFQDVFAMNREEFNKLSSYKKNKLRKKFGVVAV